MTESNPPSQPCLKLNPHLQSSTNFMPSTENEDTHSCWYTAMSPNKPFKEEIHYRIAVACILFEFKQYRDGNYTSLDGYAPEEDVRLSQFSVGKELFVEEIKRRLEDIFHYYETTGSLDEFIMKDLLSKRPLPEFKKYSRLKQVEWGDDKISMYQLQPMVMSEVFQEILHKMKWNSNEKGRSWLRDPSLAKVFTCKRWPFTETTTLAIALFLKGDPSKSYSQTQSSIIEFIITELEINYIGMSGLPWKEDRLREELTESVENTVLMDDFFVYMVDTIQGVASADDYDALFQSETDPVISIKKDQIKKLLHITKKHVEWNYASQFRSKYNQLCRKTEEHLSRLLNMMERIDDNDIIEVPVPKKLRIHEVIDIDNDEPEFSKKTDQRKPQNNKMLVTSSTKKKLEKSPASLLLQKQFSDLKKDPMAGFSLGLVDKTDFFSWQIMILGPPNTLYEGGYFKCILNFTELYPQKPPQLKFISSIWHPNIAKSGKVCISILNEPGDEKVGYKAKGKWLPTHTVGTIIDSVIFLLANPDLEAPVNLDAAEELRKNFPLFKKNVAQCVRLSLEQSQSSPI